MKIRSRIFLFFMILLAAGLFSLVRWMQGDIRPRYMEAQEDALVDFSRVLASVISSQGIVEHHGQQTINPEFLHESFQILSSHPLSAQIYDLEKRSVDIRIYVTDQRGKVIFDSDNDRDLGADYSQWRDVYLTLRGRYGARSTELDPLYMEGSILYIAAPVFSGDEIIGVVSVGKPTRNAERFMDHVINKLAYTGLFILLIAGIIGLFIHWWLTRPLQQLQQYALAVSQGENRPLPALGHNEVGDVGQAMEDMRIALEGKSYVADYVQALTHELKSPMAAIRGASELLQEDLPEKDRQHFLANIQNEIVRMQELIDRLLELAALENRPEPPSLEMFSSHKLLTELKNSMEPVARQSGICLKLESGPDIQIESEFFLLSKALTNLLKNAIEFSPPRSTVIICGSIENHCFHICIIDQGPGIPDFALNRIFSRFYALAKEDGRKGSGLGLSFVLEITRLLQADIAITNNSGQGITAKLSLPVKTA